MLPSCLTSDYPLPVLTCVDSCIDPKNTQPTGISFFGMTTTSNRKLAAIVKIVAFGVLHDNSGVITTETGRDIIVEPEDLRDSLQRFYGCTVQTCAELWSQVRQSMKANTWLCVSTVNIVVYCYIIYYKRARTVYFAILFRTDKFRKITVYWKFPRALYYSKTTTDSMKSQLLDAVQRVEGGDRAEGRYLLFVDEDLQDVLLDDPAEAYQFGSSSARRDLVLITEENPLHLADDLHLFHQQALRIR